MSRTQTRADRTSFRMNFKGKSNTTSRIRLTQPRNVRKRRRSIIAESHVGAISLLWRWDRQRHLLTFWRPGDVARRLHRDRGALPPTHGIVQAGQGGQIGVSGGEEALLRPGEGGLAVHDVRRR